MILHSIRGIHLRASASSADESKRESVMKYEIEKVGEPGKLYIETDDVVGVKPCKDGTHAIELAVRYRKQYQAEESFEWQGAGSRELKLRLVARQAMEMVAQERSTQTAFCT